MAGQRECAGIEGAFEAGAKVWTPTRRAKLALSGRHYKGIVRYDPKVSAEYLTGIRRLPVYIARATIGVNYPWRAIL